MPGYGAVRNVFDRVVEFLLVLPVENCLIGSWNEDIIQKKMQVK